MLPWCCKSPPFLWRYLACFATHGDVLLPPYWVSIWVSAHHTVHLACSMATRYPSLCLCYCAYFEIFCQPVPDTHHLLSISLNEIWRSALPPSRNVPTLHMSVLSRTMPAPYGILTSKRTFLLLRGSNAGCPTMLLANTTAFLVSLVWCSPWSTLEDQRRDAHRTLVYKIVKGEIVLSANDILRELADHQTRSAQKYEYVSTRNLINFVTHKTIKDWNAIPASVEDTDSSGCVKSCHTRLKVPLHWSASASFTASAF